MKIIHSAFAAAALCFMAGQVRAQDDQAPPYDKGPVWGFTEIKTKDGHFDEYMRFLDTDFKAENEALKKAGRLLDYKVFILSDPRSNEGNIWLAREYPNMAEFDHSTAEDYALDRSIVGSIAKANEQQAARGSIRDVLSEVVVREATLK